MSKITRGILALLALCGLSLLLLNCGSTVNRTSGLLYALIQGTNQVSSYAINLTSGSLSLINSKAATCASGSNCGVPLDIILDSTSANAFVLNKGAFNSAGGSPIAPSIYGYKVGSDGSLGSGTDLTTGASVFTAGDLAAGMVRDSAGQFLFVITEGNQAIPVSNSLCAIGTPATQGVLCAQLYVFSISSGTLSLVKATTLTFVPTSLAVNTFSSQTMLYITGNQDLNTTAPHVDSSLHQYTVDSSGNVVEKFDPAITQYQLPYATAGDPGAVLSLTTAPIGGSAGTFVYVASATAGSLSTFQLCTVQNADCAATDVTNFRLVPVGTPPTVGSNPIAMVVDPTQSFLYIVAKNSDRVFGFRINGTQGTLTALSPASLNTGATPLSIAMHSTGKFLFVSNNGSANISSYVLNTTSGSMSSPLTITSLANPAGLWSK